MCRAIWVGSGGNRWLRCHKHVPPKSSLPQPWRRLDGWEGSDWESFVGAQGPSARTFPCFCSPPSPQPGPWSRGPTTACFGVCREVEKREGVGNSFSRCKVPRLSERPLNGEELVCKGCTAGSVCLDSVLTTGNMLRSSPQVA